MTERTTIAELYFKTGDQCEKAVAHLETYASQNVAFTIGGMKPSGRAIEFTITETDVVTYPLHPFFGILTALRGNEIEVKNALLWKDQSILDDEEERAKTILQLSNFPRPESQDDVDAIGTIWSSFSLGLKKLAEDPPDHPVGWRVIMLPHPLGSGINILVDDEKSESFFDYYIRILARIIIAKNGAKAA